MKAIKNKTFLIRKAIKKHIKDIKRRKREKKRKAGFYRFQKVLKEQSSFYKIKYQSVTYEKYKFLYSIGGKPKYNELIGFLRTRYLNFSKQNLPYKEDGKLMIPKVFSISENNEETMFFLKRLFHVLYVEFKGVIYIDYDQCEYLDVDASACMDLILAGFINYYSRCIKTGFKEIRTTSINPINFNRPEIFNVLFSIGAYKNIAGIEIKNNHESDFIPFSLRIGDNKNNKNGTVKEIHETEIVDYVLTCLEEIGLSLTSDAETNLSKVVGEVMANAEEHSDFRYRYAIGYFLKPKENNNNLGIFKLSIFNFGQTIYESFKKIENQGTPVVKRMQELSSKYTNDGFFIPAKFEEETLWTFYSLQEGVTSVKNWNRGKGTIRFIDRFFRLKGNGQNDNNSKLTLISGNTNIIFDASYPLIEVKKENNQCYQMMTFNKNGNIEEQPDNKFVTFVPQNFPGTLITVKICFDNKNVNELT